MGQTATPGSFACCRQVQPWALRPLTGASLSHTLHTLLAWPGCTAALLGMAVTGREPSHQMGLLVRQGSATRSSVYQLKQPRLHNLAFHAALYELKAIENARDLALCDVVILYAQGDMAAAAVANLANCGRRHRYAVLQQA